MIKNATRFLKRFKYKTVCIIATITLAFSAMISFTQKIISAKKEALIIAKLISRNSFVTNAGLDLDLRQTTSNQLAAQC